MTRKKYTRNFGAVIRDELSNDPDLAQEVAEELFHALVARKVYELRTKASLSQKELAERIGTGQSAISRLEDADYDGHSLSTLLKIAFALKKELQIDFVEPPVFEDMSFSEELKVTSNVFQVRWDEIQKWPAETHNQNRAEAALVV